MMLTDIVATACTTVVHLMPLQKTLQLTLLGEWEIGEVNAINNISKMIPHSGSQLVGAHCYNYVLFICTVIIV